MARVAASALIVLLVVACAPPGSARYAGQAPPAGFPVGAYEKTTGDGRVLWTFRPDGVWTELHLTHDGGYAGVFKGLYRVDDRTVVIDPGFPAEYEPTTHAWRVEDGRLWTTFVAGNDEDRSYFESIDRLPWELVG